MARLVAALAAAGCVAAEEEAAELLRAADGDEQLLDELLARRVNGEPLAWVVGAVELCGVEVLVHPGVYVPRQQSEALVRRAAELLAGGGRAVDLCTGSGALALVLGRLAPLAEVFATDLDPRAVACARANGVEALLGDLDEPLPRRLFGSVDVVIGVVPYVPTAELVFLPRDVRDFEPMLALDGGARGTDLLIAAAEAAHRLLVVGGVLLLELGGEEAGLLESELQQLGFAERGVLRRRGRRRAGDGGAARALRAGPPVERATVLALAWRRQ